VCVRALVCTRVHTLNVMSTGKFHTKLLSLLSLEEDTCAGGGEGGCEGEVEKEM